MSRNTPFEIPYRLVTVLDALDAERLNHLGNRKGYNAVLRVARHTPLAIPPALRQANREFRKALTREALVTVIRYWWYRYFIRGDDGWAKRRRDLALGSVEFW